MSLLLATSLSFGACGDPEPLPELATLPDFALTDHDGEPLTRADLEGRVTVASFVFTRCPTICPMLSQRTAELQERYRARASAIQLVAFSVDPEHDTPEVLREYRARFDADPAIWTHVTGHASELERVVVQGFKVSIGEPESTSGGIDILHSSHFVLVDQRGLVRGYYRGDPDGLKALDDAIDQLL
jgi:protein SCO1/2